MLVESLGTDFEEIFVQGVSIGHTQDQSIDTVLDLRKHRRLRSLDLEAIVAVLD